MLLQAAKVLVEQKKINLELVIVGDGNHKNNCPDNLRSTCKPQHDSKSRESGDYTPQKYKEVA